MSGGVPEQVRRRSARPAGRRCRRPPSPGRGPVPRRPPCRCRGRHRARRSSRAGSRCPILRNGGCPSSPIGPRHAGRFVAATAGARPPRCRCPPPRPRSPPRRGRCPAVISSLIGAPCASSGGGTSDGRTAPPAGDVPAESVSQAASASSAAVQHPGDGCGGDVRHVDRQHDDPVVAEGERARRRRRSPPAGPHPEGPPGRTSPGGPHRPPVRPRRPRRLRRPRRGHASSRERPACSSDPLSVPPSRDAVPPVRITAAHVTKVHGGRLGPCRWCWCRRPRRSTPRTTAPGWGRWSPRAPTWSSCPRRSPATSASPAPTSRRTPSRWTGRS